MKFGEQKSYQMGDPVFVKGCPRDGAATITAIFPTHYSVDFAQGGGIEQVKTEELKPATAKDIQKWKAIGDATRARHDAAVKRQLAAIDRAAKMTPIDITGLEMEDIIAKMMTAHRAADPEAEAMLLEDAMTRMVSKTSGIHGKRMDWKPGERVRLLTDIDDRPNPGIRVKAGTLGTVVTDPNAGLWEIFPVSPGQPKGIFVKFDGYPDNLVIYHTEIVAA